VVLRARYVRTNEFYKGVRLFFGRLQRYRIYMAKVGENPYTLHFSYDWPGRPFALAYLCITVYTDNEQISLQLRLFKVFSMTDMKQVVCSGSENNAKAKLFPKLHELCKLFIVCDISVL